MLEQLISRVFYARNLAHFDHWRATGAGSFSKHMALGTFYDEIIEALDALVEAHQGQYGLICNIPAPGAAPSAETCNTIDDDCDGLVDEGACSGGCGDVELCNNLDDDCNGAVDDGDPPPRRSARD